MITVTKEGSKTYPDIKISDGKRSFFIKRKNAPDLYWIPDFHPLNDVDDISFEINENDGVVYSLFEILYSDVIKGNIFPLEKKDFQNKTEDEIKRIKREYARLRKDFQQLAQNTGLIKDGVIFWHSEDLDPFETSAVLKIERNNGIIKITFSKNKENEDFPNNWPTYAIRISESWSIYKQFFCPFVRLHRQLQALEWKESTFTNEDITKQL